MPIDTLANVKQALAVSGSDDDDLIEQLQAAADSFIETFCGRAFAGGTFTEYHPGGAKVIFLDNYPVSDISEVRVDVTREFDLSTKAWVEGGFFRPEAKGGLGWIDRDTVYVYTDFGPGSMTESGYPRVVKRWKRGTPLAAAEVVYEGKADDMYIAAMRDDTPGYERDFVSRTLAFYNDELYLVGKDGALVKVDVPNSAQKSV